MTISRPTHGRAANYARDIYCLNPLSCMFRARVTSCPNLGLQQHIVQQQIKFFYSNKTAEFARALHRCQTSRVVVQETRTIKVRLCFQHQVPFGQVLKVVGSGSELGDWQSDDAQELKWNEGHVWTGEVNLEPGLYEFKCVVAVGGSIAAWEPGPNRILQVPSGVRGIRIDGTWSQTSDNRVTVTEPIAAASVAARQKRAAAARLLAKALAEVNAAAAAAGPSAAAVAGRTQAAASTRAVGLPTTTGTVAGGGDKRSAAEALEAEERQKLRELLSPEPLSVGIQSAWSVAVKASSGNGSYGGKRGNDSEDQDQLQVVALETARHESLSSTATAAVTWGVKSGASSFKGAAVLPVAAEGGDSTGSVNKERVQDDLSASSTSVEPQQKQKHPAAGRFSRSSWRDVLSVSDGDRFEQQERQPGQREEQEQRPLSAAAQKNESSSVNRGPPHFLTPAEKLEKHDAQKQVLGGLPASGIAQSIREAAAARGEPVALRGAADAVKVGPTSADATLTNVVPDAAEAATAEAKAATKQRPSSVAKSPVQTELAKVAAAAEATAAVEVVAVTQKAPLQSFSLKQIEKGSIARTENPISTEPAAKPQSKVAEERSEAGSSRFAGILQKLEGFGVQSGAVSKVKPKAKAKDSNSAGPTLPAVRDGSKAASPSASSVGDSGKSTSKARGLAWRRLLDYSKPASSRVEAQPKQSRGVQDKAAEGTPPEEEAKPSGNKLKPKEGEEEGVSLRFAQLLASRLVGLEKRPGTEALAVAAGSTAAKQSDDGKVGGAAEQGKLQEPSKRDDAFKLVTLEVAGVSVNVAVPETPPGRDSRAQATTPSGVTSAAPVSPKEATSGRDSTGSGIGEVGDEAMGAESSRAEPRGDSAESVRNPDLDHFLGAWDAAWSQSRPKQQPASEVTILRPDNDGIGVGPSKAGLVANGTSDRDPVARAAVGPGSSGRADDRAHSRAGPVPSATNKPANGGTAVGVSSGESLYNLAERLTNGNGPIPAPTGSSDESSPGITVRMGAMAAMGVDRQGSYDNRSSYLSHSLMAESLSGGGNQEQSATALLRQLRAANAANTSAASAAANSAGTSAADDAAVIAASIPNLPATPAPPGILSSVDEDNNVDVALPRLPATPLPTSYLAGPPGGGAGAPVAPVPPLPATPVASSILSGSLGGVGAAAEGLLRRATDADSLLDMLRGNLPLTPIVRGGRGGAAGLLSMADEDGEDEGKKDATGGSGAGGQSRRKRRVPGTRLIPVLPIPGVPPDSQVDPVAAARTVASDAAQAGLMALQQSAAGLGLTPEALSESAARLLQQLPKLDAPGSQPNESANGEGNGATSGPAGLPPAVSQLATTLASGIGNVGSSLTEQLRKAGAAAAAAATVIPVAAASLTEAANGPMADTNANAAAAADGTASRANGVNGNGAANPTLISTAAGGASLLSGLLGGFMGSMAPLPSGCARLVAGAHLIPHVDKVDKGGEDAYFISRVGLGGVGVADGVSGWADEGIDPAEYPRTLMRYASDAYEAARGTMSAQDIIRYAQYRTYLKGSSTVCMALMKPGKKLEVANVGDSGVRILRNGKVIFGTEAQQHAFNMPYQLSHPNNVEDPDSADDADVHYVDVQEGDVIMLATDGLFDNVFDEEIEQIICQQLRELAAAGRGKAPSNGAASMAPAPATFSSNGTADPTAGPAAVTGSGAGGGTSGGGSSSGGGGAGGRGGKGLLSQSFSAAAAAAAYTAGGTAAAAVGGGSSHYRPEDAARVARALAERAHMHARNPTQRTPWSVTSSQQPNFMWAKFFAKGGGKMDDCTVLVAFVCGPE